MYLIIRYLLCHLIQSANRFFSNFCPEVPQSSIAKRKDENSNLPLYLIIKLIYTNQITHYKMYMYVVYQNTYLDGKKLFRMKTLQSAKTSYYAGYRRGSYPWRTGCNNKGVPTSSNKLSVTMFLAAIFLSSRHCQNRLESVIVST